MGIPHLTSIVNDSFDWWSREEIKGELIIDGYSTYHNLYSYDWSHGGQFPEFQDRVCFFFYSLRRSGIRPIVVMDGIDFTSKKEKTKLMRKESMVNTILHKHVKVGWYTREMDRRYVPPLAINVFISVIMRINIRFVVVDGEGVEWMYKLANRYCCPVLSPDSDFLMYKLKKGYIPFNQFHWEASPINAEVYHYRAFCAQNKFQDENLRLVIPAIVGNDFIAGILENLDEDTFKSTVVTMIQDLQQFRTLEDYISQVESMPGNLTKEQRKLLKSNCLATQKMYDRDEVATLEEINAETVLSTFDSKPLPDWLWRSFREGNISHSILEVLVTRKNILKVFVDDVLNGSDSCVLVSLPIRKCIYGIIGSGRVTITEYYRMERKILKKNYTSCISINDLPLPHLTQVATLSIDERKHLFYSILGCDDIRPAIVEKLDDHWHFVMAVTVFWARHTNASSQVVKALILSFVVCSGCRTELSQLRTEFFLPDEFIQSPTSMPILHSFAQWQSTYTDSLSLNELLMLPLKTASPADLYDGKLAMFFALNNSDFLRSKISIQLFERLLDKRFFPQLHDQPSTYRRYQASDLVSPFGRSQSGISCYEVQHQSLLQGRSSCHEVLHQPLCQELERNSSHQFQSQRLRQGSFSCHEVRHQPWHQERDSSHELQYQPWRQGRSSSHEIQYQPWRQGEQDNRDDFPRL